MTDGAPNVVGETVGFVKLLKEAPGSSHCNVPFHHVIHQKLCANAELTELHDVMTAVTKIVN